MNTEDIKKKLIFALGQLYRNDFLLIDRECCERSIVFRLGIYLNDIFEKNGFDVDCEYNKNGNNPKSLESRKYNYPDLIVHKRESNQENLLIIEVKTSNDTLKAHIENDIDKLEGFTSEEDYKYNLGAHVFILNKKCKINWYSNGNYVNSNILRFE